MTDEQRVARVALVVLGSVIIVVLIGYFVLGAVGGGGLGGGSDVEGEWTLTLPLETDGREYEEGEPDTVEVMVEFDRSESGELFGTASSEYAADTYSNLDVTDITEVDGKTSFTVEGMDDDDSGPDFMKILFYDNTESPSELEGNTQGQVGIYDPDVAGTFTGERQ